MARHSVRVSGLAMIMSAGLCFSAVAQTASPIAPSTPSPHAGHMMSAPNAADNASTKALKAANDTMHKDMDIAYTGDADIDFVRGMIAHHQGAVDMARVVLLHGKDAQIKTFANEIIKAQEGEIAFMKKWLSDKKLPEKSK